MNRTTLGEWVSLSGRVGRMGYWLHFMLPALGLALVGAFVPLMGIAALWLVVAGNLKRVRDLRVSQGRAALLGLWGGAMVIASVVAGGLLLFGLLAVMSNGGPDGEALMMYSVLVFLAPIVVPLLVIGFIPGGLDGETPSVAGSAEVVP